MEQAIRLEVQQQPVAVERSSFAFDTTIVLFFLAVDFGNSLSASLVDLALPLATLLTFIAVPYFLPCSGERPEFKFWALGRVFLAVFGISVGMLFSISVGSVFPEYFGHLPMTFLILSVIFSSYYQFYAILKLRLAR